MRNDFQSPVDFDNKVVIDNVAIEYHDLHEISQGGPVVGSLSINKKIIGDSLFGGPFLIYDNSIYIPAYVKKFIGWGFRLMKINMSNFHRTFIGNTKNLIFLDRVERNYLYYFEDVNKIKQGSIEL
jgi:hypothetical protein